MGFDPWAVEPGHVHACFQVFNTDLLLILGHTAGSPAIARLFSTPAASGSSAITAHSLPRADRRAPLCAHGLRGGCVHGRAIFDNKRLSD
jgi:hypothetical protein